MNAQPLDELQRQIVREETRVNLVVEAGAGTGKTSLLIDRLERLISEHSLPELVAITFTEKAAAELVDRLRRRLERPDKADSPLITHPLNRLKALEVLDRAHISTIHAFASSLIRSYPFEANVDPDFDHMDDAEQSDLIDELIAAEFGRIDTQRDDDLIEFIEAGASLKVLGSLTHQLAKDYDPALMRVADVAPIHLAVLGQQLARRLAQLHSEAAHDCLDQTDKGLVQIEETARTIPAEQATRRVWLDWLNEVAHLDLRKGAKPKWRGDSLTLFKEQLTALRAEAGEILAQYRGALLASVLKRQLSLVEQLQSRKRMQGKLTFHDQLLYARNLLAKPEIRSEIAAHFKALLIDEFQDTDPLQTDIVLALSGLSDAGPHPVSAEGRLSIVGDPKQSIYRFRGAEAALFRQVSDRLGQFGKKINISQNFRSSGGVIDFVNAFFTPLWPDFGGSSIEYVPILATPDRPTPAKQPPVEILEPPEEMDAGKAPVDEIRVLEAKAVASTINRALSEGWEILPKGSRDGCLRPIKPGDIAILMPGRTGIEYYAEALTEAGLSFHIEGGKATFSRQLATDVLNIVRAIDLPADKLSVVAAIRSSIFGATDVEVAEWGRLSGNSFDYFSPPDGLSDHLTTVLCILRDLQKKSRGLRPDLLLEQLAESVSLQSFLNSGPELEIDLELWQQILKAARATSLESGGDLRQFRRRLDRLISGAEKTTESGEVTENGRIRLLTIHLAKGLEFPMVILANLGRPRNESPTILIDRLNGGLNARINGHDGVVFETRDYSAALSGDRQAGEEEHLRHLYVAMTRARDHLVISRIHSSKGNPYYAWMSDFSASTGCFSRRREDLAELKPYETRPLPTPAIEDSLWEIDVESMTSVLASLVDARKAGQAAAAAKALHIIRPSYHNPEEDEIHSLVESGAGESAAKIGRAVHRYMAECTPGHAFDSKLMESISLEEGAAIAEARPLIETLLASEVWKQAIACGRIHREVPISVMKRGGLLRGVIDLVWHDSFGLHILDFKTGAKMPEHHKKQMVEYAKALKSATGLAVPSVWLLYAASGEAIHVSDNETEML